VLAVASALLLAAAAPPEPSIYAAPPATTTKSSATFSFRVIGRDYDYECKVGSRLERFAPCTSPYVAAGLPVGTHTFQVRAVEGNTSGLPAMHTWTITAIDDDGDGHALPADCDDADAARFPGAPEVAANGVDEDCDGADFVPYVPVPTAPVSTPTPSPAPAPTPAKPKIAITLSYFMNARKRHTRFSSLNVKGVPKGATVAVTCRGGCPRKTQTFNKPGTVALTGFRNRAIRAGAKLTIAVTKPGSIGMAKVVTIRSDKRPRITTQRLR
jgi:hypothetical protein